MLKFIRLTPDSPEYDDVIGLYVSAFPDDERRPLDDFRTVLAENPFSWRKSSVTAAPLSDLSLTGTSLHIAMSNISP